MERRIVTQENVILFAIQKQNVLTFIAMKAIGLWRFGL